MDPATLTAFYEFLKFAHKIHLIYTFPGKLEKKFEERHATQRRAERAGNRLAIGEPEMSARIIRKEKVAAAGYHLFLGYLAHMDRLYASVTSGRTFSKTVPEEVQIETSALVNRLRHLYVSDPSFTDYRSLNERNLGYRKLNRKQSEMAGVWLRACQRNAEQLVRCTEQAYRAFGGGGYTPRGFSRYIEDTHQLHKPLVGMLNSLTPN